MAVPLVVPVVASFVALACSAMTTVTISPLLRALKSSARDAELSCQIEPVA